MSDSYVTNLAYLTAKEGKSEQLGQKLKQLLQPSREEAGCLRYDLHQSSTDLNQWFFYEVWRSQEDLDRHFQQLHMQDFMEAAPALLNEPILLHSFRPAADLTEKKLQ